MKVLRIEKAGPKPAVTHTGELVRPAVQAARMEPWHLSLLVLAGSRGDLDRTNLLFSCRGEMLPAGKMT